MDVDAGEIETTFVVSVANALGSEGDANILAWVPLRRVNTLALGELHTLFIRVVADVCRHHAEAVFVPVTLHVRRMRWPPWWQYTKSPRGCLGKATQIRIVDWFL